MRHEILGRPDYAVARVHLEQGESIWAESGAMIAHTGLAVETSARGGALAGLARKAFTGETFFQNRWVADSGPGHVDLAPGVPGDVLHLPLDGRLIVQRGSYLACAEGVEVSTEMGGVRAFLAEGSIFLLHASGVGDLFLASYGAIEEIQVDGEYRIDNGHLVAWETTLDHSIERVGSWKATILSGEGIVVGFRGRGRVWIQTRALPALAAWIHPYRRVQKSDDG